MKEVPTNATRTIRCAVYARVSTEEQARKEFSSLDSQRAVCERFIRANPTWVYSSDRYYEDAGISGKDVRRRGVQRLFRDIEDGKINLIVIKSKDRLFRNLQEELELMMKFAKMDVVVFADGRESEIQTPSGFMNTAVLGAVAQMERMLTSIRTKAKIHEARLQGYWTGGMRPLGYDSDGKKGLTINKAEASQVRAMFQVYIKEQSLDKALPIINKRFRTKSWVTNGGKRRGGRAIAKTSYSLILKNHLYLGKQICDGALVKANFPPIIDQATFDRAQKLLAFNRVRRNSIIRNKHEFLLRGLLHCTHCGSAMTSSQASGRDIRVRHFYYRCTSISHRGKSSCPVRSVSARFIEVAVLKKIKELAKSEVVIKMAVEELQKKNASEVPSVIDSIRELAVKKRKVDVEATRLIDAMKATGASTNRLVLQELERLETSQRELEAKQVELGADLQAAKRQTVDPATVRKALKAFSVAFESLRNSEKVQLLQLAIKEVRYDGLKKRYRLSLYPFFRDLQMRLDALKKNTGQPQLSGFAPCSDWLPGPNTEETLHYAHIRAYTGPVLYFNCAIEPM